EVIENFWKAVAPAELECYDEALVAYDKQCQQLARARQQQLERLRYEARLAEKQYRLGDPENRLVARELEHPRERALQEVRRAEAEATNTEAAETERLPAELRQQWQKVHPTLRQLWDEGKLNNVRKKELLRVLIDKVVLQRPAPDKCQARIVWRGGD